ncbi:ISL3 family transposase [Streptomyces argenteolus]|uniref:transposase n=1 Tax=Streptomyces sp. NPDC025273 TaxID=3155251 RepID=UPI0033D29CAD
MESRRPVDLLPDREASSPVAWLAKRPGVEIVSRDRTSFRRPHPRQAPDRPRTAGGRAQSQGDLPPAPHDLAHRQAPRRRSRPGGPLPWAVQGRPSKLDTFKPYLDDRWNQGCTNAWTVWEEIVPLGYQDSYQRVRAYFREKRLSSGPVTARPPSPRGVGWILRRPETLTETEHLRLRAVLVHCPERDALTGHVRSFGQILTERQGERLPQWLDAVRRDNLPGLRTLAAGIDRDRDAVIAGLTLPWSSGVVEGHVNRIKMLKRQMFGRAGFALLRERVLPAS